MICDRCGEPEWHEVPKEWEATPRWRVWLFGEVPTRRRVIVYGPTRGECLDWWDYEPRPDDGRYHLPDEPSG